MLNTPPESKTLNKPSVEQQRIAVVANHMVQLVAALLTKGESIGEAVQIAEEILRRTYAASKAIVTSKKR